VRAHRLGIESELCTDGRERFTSLVATLHFAHLFSSGCLSPDRHAARPETRCEPRTA